MAAGRFSFNFLTHTFQSRHVARVPFERGGLFRWQARAPIGRPRRSWSLRAAVIGSEDAGPRASLTHRGAGRGDEHQSPSVNTGGRKRDAEESKQIVVVVFIIIQRRNVNFIVVKQRAELLNLPQHKLSSMWIFLQLWISLVWHYRGFLLKEPEEGETL